MPPKRSEYQPLAQSADGGDDSLDADLSADLSADGVLPPPVQQAGPSRVRGRRVTRRGSGSIDLSKLDTAFKRWTESIAQKVSLKRKKKVEETTKKEILHSVFEPAVLGTILSGAPVKTLDHKPPMTQAEWDAIVNAVRHAILEGLQPKMITKGSSGSYFARAKVNGRVQTVGVFKPKDEEPYGRLNPKTTKWLHRQLRFIIPFGRACLIPNLSYISEAAASLLDQRLHLFIVPRTELVSLSSPAFFYDWMDRNAAKKGKQLPDKIGSMQNFMHGYTDASDFLRQHPWPGRAISDTFDDSSHRTGNYSKRLLNALKVVCGRTGEDEDMYDDGDEERAMYDMSRDGTPGQPFYWSDTLQQSFREELEKLVILDYLMRNTDRGADNYMIKYCDAEHDKSLVDVAPARSALLSMPQMSEFRRDPIHVDTAGVGPAAGASSNGTPTMGPSSALPPSISRSSSGAAQPPPYTRKPHIHIAAIDNSLSFPHEHPKGWRSYTYGWLYLPVSIVGRPFSEKTRSHFLPMLTSKLWWEETTFELRKIFAVDPDFHPKMFRRQLAVMKGQAFNIVQSLKHADEGPLELTRRKKVLVWDDEVEVTDDTLQDIRASPLSPSPRPPSMMSRAFGKRARSQSFGPGDFPPSLLRTSTDGTPRPVPFAKKFKRVHPATTGVAVLEHMEQLDAVEANLQRLGVEEAALLQEEVDVGESSTPRASQNTFADDASVRPLLSPRSAPLPAVPEAAAAETEADTLFDGEVDPFGRAGEVEEDLAQSTSQLDASMNEEDLAALSKSMSHIEPSPSRFHTRWTSHPDGPQGGHPGLDWINSAAEEAGKKRTVIVERLEPIDVKPLCSCW